MVLIRLQGKINRLGAWSVVFCSRMCSDPLKVRVGISAAPVARPLPSFSHIAPMMRILARIRCSGNWILQAVNPAQTRYGKSKVLPIAAKR
jgi:hypothetical protein